MLRDIDLTNCVAPQTFVGKPLFGITFLDKQKNAEGLIGLTPTDRFYVRHGRERGRKHGREHGRASTTFLHGDVAIRRGHWKKETYSKFSKDCVDAINIGPCPHSEIFFNCVESPNRCTRSKEFSMNSFARYKNILANFFVV